MEQDCCHAVCGSSGGSADFYRIDAAVLILRKAFFMKQDYILASSSGDTSLPDALQQFYASFKDNTPGEYTMGIGAGIDGIPFGPVTITVDNTRVSVVSAKEYESAINKDLELIVLQGYAQVTLFDRFYASCILIGEYSPENAGSVVTLVDHLSRTEEEREQLEQKKIDEVKIHPAFYTQIYNDPINNARNTCGIYIIRDNLQQIVACETVFQAIGIADFADNAALGLAIAVSANVNTFTDSMTFSVAGSLRFADSERFTIAGEVGILNGKLNAIGFTVKSKVLIGTEVYLTQGMFSIKGFQEPKIAVGFGGGVAIGSEIRIPEGLGVLRKALFPNLTKFHPLELTVSGELNPMRNYYSLSGKGVFMGNIAVSASVAYDDGNWDAELKAGTVRNNYLNGSLSVDFHKRQDNWSLHGNFSCSVSVDFGQFVGVSVSGGVDILLNSQDYIFADTRYNRKDLTITVSGMGKVKLFFSFNISVQKTWVFNLSNTQLSADTLMKTLSAGDMMSLEDAQDIMVCESEDITETQLSLFRISSDVIESKSWQIDEQCSASGTVRFQVAAEYTLVDSNWRLTHSDGTQVTVYTSENADGIVTVQSFTHNYYELLLDTPDAGNWTLEILGDSQSSGGIYMDALKDEKFITGLEVLEQTEQTIKFRYTAFTGSKEDTTLVRLCAEEISAAPGDNPFSGVIAYLEETENGEFVWEIPEEFLHNAQYRFYLSAASSGAGAVTESSSVEVYLARQKADLDCSWELVYSAENPDTVTAYITITNTGIESTACLWEILDCTNNDSVDADDVCSGNTSEMAEVIASGSCFEIKGNSSVTFQQIITVTDELRDDPSSLQLSVSQCAGEKQEKSGSDDENYADDTDMIMFSALDSTNCQKETVSWQAVDGAVSYVLQYALEGDWEESGVYINDIYDTSYTLSVAPGEYVYRVIAIGSDGKALGSWSAEQEFDVLFQNTQTISILRDTASSRSQVFSLNDGIYDLNGGDLQNFTGTLTLYRHDLVKAGTEDGSAVFNHIENEILSLCVVNGVVNNPMAEILLDNGEYFWEWFRTGTDTAFDITIELTGEVFSMEQDDREIISIGDGDPEMPLVGGVYVETLKGEVGFCNKDAVYQYMTDDGGELSLTIKSGTVFDARLKLHIYVQNSADGDFDCVESLTVAAGEYTQDTVILSQLAIKNNFYVEVASWDNGQGGYNTDYSFDLSFDAFEDSVQSEDILVVNGGAVSDWIGYRNEAHSYLLQIRNDDFYAVRLQGDAFDAVLKVCRMDGSVIEEKQIEADGTAYLDDIYLESGNYFVVVESVDKGEGNFNTDYILSAAESKTLYPEIDNCDDTFEQASLLEPAAFDTSIKNWLGTGDETDFFKFSLAPEMSSTLLLTFDIKTAEAIENGLLEVVCCDKWGETLTIDVLPAGQWSIETLLAGTEMYIGFTCDRSIRDFDYSFKVSESISADSLSGSADGIRWGAVSGAAEYVVEYSSDNFATVLDMETVSSEIDFYGLASGTYQWRVKVIDGVFSPAEQISAENDDAGVKLVSDADGNIDVFFADANDTWGSGFAAVHQTSGELVVLDGMNRITNVFCGSDDASLLILTDALNGDALFVDDIYSALGSDGARLAQIDEIRAGAGDDIIDMTSSRFAYDGRELSIRGGAGNDVIWASGGGNKLFGDAGDDRITGGAGSDLIVGGSGDDSMYSGGGDDIFAFCENWGSDTVEITDNTCITLWFSSGSESNWDPVSRIYRDGSNTVTVYGGVNSHIELKFGDAGGQYADLLEAGAFEPFTGEKIFEDKDKGTLA